MSQRSGRRIIAGLIAGWFLVGCTTKTSPSMQNHDPGQSQTRKSESAPVASQDAFSTAALSPYALQASQSPSEVMTQVVLPLQALIFDPAHIGDAMTRHSLSFLAALDQYQTALLKVLTQAPNTSRLNESLSAYVEAVFSGCSVASMGREGYCAYTDLFQRSQQSADILVALARRESKIETRYAYLMMAFQVQNRVFNQALTETYLAGSYDFAKCLQDLSCTTPDNAGIYKQHMQYLSMLVGSYPKTADRTVILARLQKMHLLDLESNNPLHPVQKDLVSEFGADLIYHGQELTQEFRDLIATQAASPQSILMTVQGWRALNDTPEHRAAHTAFQNMIKFDVDSLKGDEYFYIIEGLYMGKIDDETAQLLWSASHQNRMRFIQTVKHYCELRMLEAVLHSNQEIHDLFLAKSARVRPENIRRAVELDSTTIRTDVWNGFLASQQRLFGLYREARLPIDPGAPKTDIARLEIDVDTYFHSFDHNLNILAVAPNMWAMGHVMQEQGINFDYSGPALGSRDNGDYSYNVHNGFFRDMLEFGISPWYNFAQQNVPLTRQENLLALHNVFRMGLPELYGFSKATLLTRLASYYLTNSNDLLKDAYQHLSRFTTGNTEMNGFMGLCAREAETACSDPVSSSSTADGAFRICRHRETLEPFRNLRNIPNLLYAKDLPTYVMSGNPTSNSRTVLAHYSPLENGTAFYFYPHYELQGVRRMDDMLEITREDSMGRVAYLRAIAKGLLESYPGDAEIAAGVKTFEDAIQITLGYVDRIHAQTLIWEDRIGDCYLLLARQEQNRQYQLMQAESETLHGIYQDMKALRALKSDSHTSLSDFQTKVDELNAKYRVEHDPIFAGVKNLATEFSVQQYGFDDRAMNYSASQFLLRTIRYLNSGTPSAPGHPIDALTPVQLPSDAHDLTWEQANVVTAIPWQENEESFVNQALAVAAKKYVKWFHLNDSWGDLALMRARVLMRLQKFDRIEIASSIWKSEGGGSTVSILKPCTPSDSNHVCFQPDNDQIVDTIRAQAQMFQLSAQDESWLPRLNLDFRLPDLMFLPNLYCTIAPGKSGVTIQICEQFLNHFDFYFNQVNQATTIDAPIENSMGAADAESKARLAHDDILTVASQFQVDCEDQRYTMYADGFNPLAPVNDYITARVQQEFNGRRAFKDAVMRRHQADVLNQQVVPKYFNLAEPKYSDPPYVTQSNLDDVTASETNFNMDTNDYFKEGRKCLVNATSN